MTINKRFYRLGVVALAIAGWAGCDPHEVRVYRVPKETNVVKAARGPASGANQAQARPGLRWANLPAGWEDAGASGMRAASFRVRADGAAAEVTVTPLAGVTGILTDSLNMWRSDLNLPPFDKEQAAAAGEKVEVGDHTSGAFYDFAGTLGGQKGRIIGAIAEHEGTTWFFKMSGADELVAKQKGTFTEFLKTVSFVEDEPGHAVASSASRAPADAAPGLPKWDAPSHWQSTAPGAMLLAKFNIPGEGAGKAEVTVSSLAGSAGGMLANVNRWRNLQLGLPTITEADLSKFTSPIDLNGLAATLVDLKAEKANAQGADRIMVIVVPREGMTWFYKLSGPSALVGKEKPGFIKFVQSVRYGHAA